MKKISGISALLALLALSACKVDMVDVAENSSEAGLVVVSADKSQAANDYLNNSVTWNSASAIAVMENSLDIGIDEYGIYYSKEKGFSLGQAGKVASDNLGNVNGFGANSFSGNMTGLDDATTYYYRFYVKHAMGISYSELSDECSFTTEARMGVPFVNITTGAVIYADGPVVNVAITHTGNYDITSCGLRYGTSASNLNMNASAATWNVEGTRGSFSVDLSGVGLTQGIPYHFEAYVVNQAGEGKSEVRQITMERARELPVLSIVGVQVLSKTSVRATFKVETQGIGAITEYGYYLFNQKFSAGTGSPAAVGEDYDITVENLSTNINYEIYPYAVNSDGESKPISPAKFETGIPGKNEHDKHLVYQELPAIESGGKKYIFLDRNLGSTKRYQFGEVATPDTDAGWAFQWGRDADGHQLWTSPVVTRTSGLTSFPVSENEKGKFIANTGSWVWIEKTVTPDYTTFWTSNEDGGINNPCPIGFRVPTNTELGLFITNRINMYIPATMIIRTSSGGLKNTANGNFWTCTVDPNNAKVAAFQGLMMTWATPSLMSSTAQGNFVRCVRVE